MNRKALEFYGHNPAPGVAFVCGDRPGERRIVTWDDVMETRRKRQAVRLEHKLSHHPTRAYRVWVAYFDMTLMGGWQAFIENHRTMHGYGGWIDRDRRQLMGPLMKAFPLVLPLGSERDQWERWKPEFAKQYQRGRQDRRPRGCSFVWWDERHDPIPATLQLSSSQKRSAPVLD